MRDYVKRKQYLICIDSDGCAMDTMDVKHERCFGPRMVEEWGLTEWEEPILKRWNELNLYSMTRGINRFKGLARMLREVNDTYCPIEGIETLERWVEESPELSNPALERAIGEAAPGPLGVTVPREAAPQATCNSTEPEAPAILSKALSWSRRVNASIDALPDEAKRPFEGVKEALAFAHTYADIAIVSSANLQAVEEEWTLHGLMEQVDILLAQDAGSKAFCIGELLKKGYDADKVMMTGDAPGDYEAAKQSGVFFYPILVRHEAESWREFVEQAVPRLRNGTYGGEYQEAKEKAFADNLRGSEKSRQPEKSSE